MGQLEIGDWLFGFTPNLLLHQKATLCTQAQSFAKENQNYINLFSSLIMVLSEESWKGQVTCHRKDTALSDQQIDLLIKTFLAQTDR